MFVCSPRIAQAKKLQGSGYFLFVFFGEPCYLAWSTFFGEPCYCAWSTLILMFVSSSSSFFLYETIASYLSLYHQQTTPLPH
jgi:hypothetical protein